MTILATLLLLAQASRATQEAYGALKALGLTEAAAHCHRAGEELYLVVGLVVKAEAEKRRAELAGVSS